MKILVLYLGFIFLIGCSNQPEVVLNKFPNTEFDKAVAFKMNGQYGEIIENGQLSENVVGQGVILDSLQIATLLNIYADPSTYGNVAASCFEPHLGFTFIKNRRFVAHSTVCFYCNSMRTTPYIGNGIFSEKGRDRLFELEQQIFKTTK